MTSNNECEMVRVLTPEGRLVSGEGLDAGATLSMDPAILKKIYQGMLRGRLIDERMERLQRQGRVGFHVGALGEEAAIVASAAALREQDWIFPCYRELAALLYRGFPLERYLDNMFGNAGDVVQGRQMPDHYTGKQWRYASVSSPVGTQIPHAVGFAWAAKIRRDDLVTGVFFGDGATSSNDFHAAMTLAGVKKLPVVFLCRNNYWAISVPTSKQTAAESFAAKASGYGMPGVRCDGADPAAVYQVVSEAVERAARGAGPTLVELVAHRLGGHSTSDNPKAYLDDEAFAVHKTRDPLLRTRSYLESIGLWDAENEARFCAGVDAELQEAIGAAEEKAPPPLSSLFSDVYEAQPWHLAQQERELLEGTRAPTHG